MEILYERNEHTPVKYNCAECIILSLTLSLLCIELDVVRV